MVFAVGLKAAKAAQLEIVDIPVVYSMVLDPAKYGLNAQNMTGVLLEVPAERQLAMIRNLLPQLKHIGTLYDPAKTSTLIDEARRLLKQSGTELAPMQISSERDVPEACVPLLPSVDALWLVPDSTVLTDESLRFILNTALEARVPVIGFSREFLRGAGVIVPVRQLRRHRTPGGQLTRKLLEVSSLPLKPWHPDRIETSLNLKTAKFLGIDIPRELSKRPTSCIDERTVCERSRPSCRTAVPPERAETIRQPANQVRRVFSLIIIFTCSGMSWYFIHSKRVAMTERVQDLGSILVKNLAHNVRYGIILEDRVILEQFIDGVLGWMKSSTQITGADGQVAARAKAN